MIRKLLAITVASLVLSMPAQSQGTPDSVFVRAQKMVSDGNAGRGRAVVDSMLRSSRRGSPAYAEALFWRATLAASSQQSEQDYRRLVVEYPLYARTGDVLLRLAQLELLRGNRDAAAVHLRRIQTEHPEFGNQAAASYWLGRVLFEKNDLAGACGAIADAKRIVKPDDVELANQIEYQNQQCAGVVISAPDTTRLVEVTSVPLPGPVTRAPAPAGTLPTPSTANSPGPYSVQVAAYNKKTQATELVSRLSRRGFSARVDGSRAPYRVRIGQYATRADAVAAQQRIKKGGITGIVVKVD